MSPPHPPRRVFTPLRLGPALVLAGLSLGWGAARGAEAPINIVLDYRVRPDAASCPSAEELQANVTRQLGYDPFQPAAKYRVAITLDRHDERYTAQLLWSDLDGHNLGDRSFLSRASDCRELAAHVTFSVAVQVQLLAALGGNGSSVPAETPPPPSPDVAAERMTPSTSASSSDTSPAKTPEAPEPPEQLPPEPPPPPEPPEQVEPPAPAEPPGPRHFSVSAGLGASAASGVAPSIAAVGRAFVALSHEDFSFTLGFDGAPSVSTQRADGGGVAVRHLAIEGAGCWQWAPFHACLTGTVGRLYVRGFGVDEPATPSGWFALAGVRAEARQPLGQRFFVSLHADARTPLARAVVVLNGQEIWRAPWLGAQLGLDLGIVLY